MKPSPTVKVRVMRTQIYFSAGLTERNVFTYIVTISSSRRKEGGPVMEKNVVF